MRKRVALLAVLLSIVLYPSASARLFGQEPSSEVSAAFAEGGDLWFVELSGAPVADGGSLTQVRNEKAAFRRAAAQAGVRFEERRAFDTLWNGLSVRINRSELGKLSRIAGVKAIYPNVAVTVPAGAQPVETPELITALSLTGVDVAQNELGLTGEGIKVAVMDTGVDYHHPDLGGCFGAGCRVFTGHDFVGNAFTGGNTPVPDSDPDDCNGHGTHVAGIVGANGVAKGVAPGVTFGAYKVFGCDGSTNADIMIAAMERALADGMDVLNMSIGAAFQWPQYPTAQASDRMVNRGMVVVTSAGNSGANGIYSISAPGVGQKVIAVASFDNTHANLSTFSVSPDGKSVGYANATAAPPAPLTGTFPLARTGTTTTTNDGCAALPAGSLSGQIALIRRGTCGFHDKARNAQTAGAVGVVLYNNAAGRVSPTVAGAVPITIPVVAITAADGAVMDARIASGGATLTWTNASISDPLATAGLISGFSSYGLSPDLALKPDLGAPGGQIRSTYPIELGSYASISGTSMASPHVAGAVALLLQARPNTPAQAVRGILQNAADPHVWGGNPALGLVENVHRQGAGMLDVVEAIQSSAKVEPSKLSLGESAAGAVTSTLTVQNDGPRDVTYVLSHVPALSTGPQTYPQLSFFTGFADAVFGAPSVTVPAGGSASFAATITANASLAERSAYGGYIVLTPQGGGAALRVPYSGLKGDYQTFSPLDPAATAFGFPWLAKLSGTTLTNQPTGATYTMVGNDIPQILVHLDHQVRNLRLDVTEVATGKSWHSALDVPYVGRNGARAPNADNISFFFQLPWDGTTAAGNKVYTVPNGQYRVTVTVIKALGDEATPGHTESWTSPVITIARPAAVTP